MFMDKCPCIRAQFLAGREWTTFNNVFLIITYLIDYGLTDLLLLCYFDTDVLKFDVNFVVQFH